MERRGQRVLRPLSGVFQALAHSIKTTDGTELRYWIRHRGSGPAPPLLFIHGAASNHTRWSEFVRTTTLADRYDLVRPDMRGNAQSMWRGRLDLGVWCRDLDAILRAEGYGPAIVVGHSLGAQIALRLAAAYPQRVRALALIDPVVPEALIGKRRTMRQLAPLFRLAVGIIRGVNRLGLKRRSFPLMDLEALDAETREAMQGDHPQAELVRRYSALGLILEYMPLANYLQQLLATSSPLPRLESITAPTLVLESAGVGFMDRDRSRAELARLPGLELTGIDATHWPLTERPDEVRQAIEAWINRIDGESPAQAQHARI
jgi:pimeloyl-ACP methyl ester carboxylesterase